jgi:hypothetical protein
MQHLVAIFAGIVKNVANLEVVITSPRWGIMKITTTDGKEYYTDEGCLYCRINTAGQHEIDCPMYNPIERIVIGRKLDALDTFVFGGKDLPRIYIT